MKRIYHYGQLFCFFCADTLVYGARMRTVRNASRVKCDHATRNIFPAHEIAVNIVKHFITINIAMIIWGRNSLGVIVEQTWTK